MKYKLKAYSILEFGKRKDIDGNPHQEDAIYPSMGEASPDDRLFMICDGMGGHDAGEVASQTVCEAISESILNDGHDNDGIFSNDDLINALEDAYTALNEKDNGSPKKMGTTLALLKLHNDGATVAHIGDSRVYHIRPGRTEEDTEILFVTEDHSLVNSLVKAGEITKQEARHSKQRNIITRAMQPSVNRCEADTSLITDIKPGDFFYLCSDGMLEQYEMEDGSALKRIFSDEIPSPEEKVKILRGATANNSDNHSAYIVHILEIDDREDNSILSSSLTKETRTSFIDKILSFFKDEI